MLAAPPAVMPPLARPAPVPPPAPGPPPATPTQAERLRAALAADIAQGAVSVPDGGAAVLRLDAAALFAPGSATLLPASAPLLHRVAAALAALPPGAAARAIGYTDNQPVRTVRFPSNFEFSAARARAVSEALGRAGAPPLVAEGRGEAEPLAANATAEGRARNRRIEIVADSPAP
jgi:type VI secretion system protein ImpK